jgi:thiol-disulfide isomerase/thioredoxin
MGQAERLLPIMAAWGAWTFAATLILAMVGILRLARGRRWLIPARWPARIGSLFLVGVTLTAALGLCLVLGPLHPVLAQVRQVRSVIDHPARELEFQTVADESPHRLSELRGRVVVLNLWATWCGPCRHELPGIDRLARDYAARGLVVVTLSTETRERLVAFAKQYADVAPAATMNVYAAHAGWLDVPGRPLTVLIDRDGVVRDVFVGARTYEELAKSLRRWVGPTA